MTTVTTRDRDIITKSFRLLTRGVPPSELLDQLNWDRYFNVFSSAPGDNRYVNPIAQASPLTDPRYGRMMETPEGGMGSIYKSVYDNNATLLTITPGVAQFAGLLSFITNMFNPTAAIIANKGRAPGIAFYIGQAAGSIAFWPMQLVSISVQFLAFLADSPKNNFYTVKPAMGAYTMASNGVLNDLLVKLGYTDPVLPMRNQQQTDPLYGLKHNHQEANAHSVAALSRLMPDSINPDGTIDLMRYIMKGTRKHRVMIKKLKDLDNEVLRTVDEKLVRAQQLMEEVYFDPSVWSGSPTQDFIEKEMNSVSKSRGDEEGMYAEQDSAYLNQKAYNELNNADQGLNTVTNPGAVVQQPADPAAMQSMSTSGSFGTGTPPINPNESATRSSVLNGGSNPAINGGEQIAYQDNPDDRSWMGDIYDLVETAIAGGLDAITWRVDGATGPVTDSFANTHTKSAMAEKFNSVVKSANDFKFDIAGGATGIGIVDGIVNTIKDLGMGALSGSVIGNIPLALANNAQVKIADHWDGSTTNLHKEPFSMYFDCTYAHPYEQITKIWIPFSLFLPLVAPFSAGGATSTSPFLVKAFCQSRSIIRTGLITQATFTFGAGDAGWTNDRKPLNMRIDFEVTDLEDIISVPIDRSLSILDLTNPAAVVNRMLSDDTGYNNYLSRLTGLSYLDTVLRYSRINRSLTGIALDIRQSISAQNMAAKVSDSVAGDLLRIFTKPIAR